MSDKKEEYEAAKQEAKDERKDRHSADPKTGVKQQVKKDGGGGKFTQGKTTDQDGPAVLDKGDPNYDSEGEDKDAVPDAPGGGYPTEKKEAAWEGAAAGKYQWDEPKGVKSADDAGLAISKYSWSDGKKQVSIYIELEGLDDVADDAITTESGEKNVSMVIAAIAGKRRTFVMHGLANEIDGVTLQRKKGKNMVVLKLKKKEEQPWYQLQEKSAGGGGDDEEEGGGGGGGMGGMDMASMMGGMGGGGGGMGGMDMASMMGGMGGMGM